MQELALEALLAGARGERPDFEPLIRAARNTLRSNELDPAFKAEAILLPQEGVIAERIDVIDPDAIHRVARGAADRGRRRLFDDLAKAQAASASRDRTCHRSPRGPGGSARSRWDCLSAGDAREGARLAKAQFDAADNMTDRQGALGVLVSLDAPEREQALAAFFDRFKDDALVLDKWFALQAAAQRHGHARRRSRQLASHPSFTLAESEPAARARRQPRHEPLGVQPRFRARLPLPRRHDHRGRQAESADRCATGAAARPLAEARTEPRRR